jgi:hypothetical protein
MRVFAAAAFLISASAPAHAVEISNFRSGLACTNSPTGDAAEGWICHDTEEVLVTDLGRCEYDGRILPCTWVGFEFDYRNARPGDRLECTLEQSQPTAFGNPQEQLSEPTTSQDFVLPLDKPEGHFYNSQYFTFAVRAGDKARLLTTGRCRFEGKVVFEYTYRLQFPKPPEQAAAGRAPGPAQ